MTEKKLIDKKLALKLLKRAVEEKGADYVDPRSSNPWDAPGCKYFKRNGHPSCIVGHVLSYADARPFSVRSLWNEQRVESLANEFPQLFTEGAQKVLTTAQDVQDCGDTWGDAYLLARDL